MPQSKERPLSALLLALTVRALLLCLLLSLPKPLCKLLVPPLVSYVPGLHGTAASQYTD